MKEKARLGDGKEGAQGGLSLSYFHFIVYILEFLQRFAGIRQVQPKKTQYILPSHPSPRYSAFIHPISANKPILSALTVGFISSTVQSASTKPNMHAGTSTMNYTHTKNKNRKKGMKAKKIILFHTEMKR